MSEKIVTLKSNKARQKRALWPESDHNLRRCYTARSTSEGGVSFETAIIERYRRRESRVEEAQTCWPTRLRSTLALDVENLPAPAVSLEEQDSVAADKKESVFKSETVAGKISV